MTSFTWLPDAAWRGALLLAIAFVVARLLRGQPAAVRHVLWTGTLAGVMAMPILAAVAPVVPVTVPQSVLQRASPVASDKSLGASGVVTVQVDEKQDVEGATPSASASGTSDLGSAIQAVTTTLVRCSLQARGPSSSGSLVSPSFRFVSCGSWRWPACGAMACKYRSVAELADAAQRGSACTIVRIFASSPRCDAVHGRLDQAGHRAALTDTSWSRERLDVVLRTS